MKDRTTIYEPHPVTPERKAHLLAQGYRILDAVFAPADYVHPEAEAEAERLAAEQAEAERLEVERLAWEHAEAERLAAEQADVAPAAAEPVAEEAAAAPTAPVRTRRQK